MPFRYSDYGVEADDAYSGANRRVRFPLWWVIAFIAIVGVAYFAVSKYTTQQRRGRDEAEKNRPSVSGNHRTPPLKGLTIEQIIRPDIRPAVEKEPEAPVAPKFNPALNRLFDLVTEAVASNDLNRARELLLPIVEQPGQPPEAVRLAEKKIGEISIPLVFSELPMGSAKVPYTVVAGDTPDGIARRHGIPTAGLLRSAKITDPRALRLGRRLLLLNNPEFTWERQTEKNSIVLKLNGKFFKRYPLIETGDYKIWINGPEGKQLIRLPNSEQLAEINALIRY